MAAILIEYVVYAFRPPRMKNLLWGALIDSCLASFSYSDKYVTRYPPPGPLNSDGSKACQSRRCDTDTDSTCDTDGTKIDSKQARTSQLMRRAE